MANRLTIIPPAEFECDSCTRVFASREDAERCCHNYMHEDKQYPLSKYQFCNAQKIIEGKIWYCRHIRLSITGIKPHCNDIDKHTVNFIEKHMELGLGLEEIQNQEFQITVDMDTINEQNVILLSDFTYGSPEGEFFLKK